MLPPIPAGPANYDLIVVLRQEDDECPTTRSCPGLTGMEKLCEATGKCTNFWSSGCSVRLSSLDATLSVFNRKTRDACGRCGQTISLTIVIDGPVALALA